MWLSRGNLREFLCGGGTVLCSNCCDGGINLYMWQNFANLYTKKASKNWWDPNKALVNNVSIFVSGVMLDVIIKPCEGDTGALCAVFIISCIKFLKQKVIKQNSKTKHPGSSHFMSSSVCVAVLLSISCFLISLCCESWTEKESRANILSKMVFSKGRGWTVIRQDFMLGKNEYSVSRNVWEILGYLDFLPKRVLCRTWTHAVGLWEGATEYTPSLHFVTTESFFPPLSIPRDCGFVQLRNTELKYSSEKSTTCGIIFTFEPGFWLQTGSSQPFVMWWV